jgi:hypothetical protein
LFSVGTVWLAKDLGIGVNGGVALWHRIGTGGTIAKSIGTTTSFRADRDGRLMLIAKPPGEWLDETGRFEPDYPHAGGNGALTVAVLVWPGSAKEGLAKLRFTDESGSAAREIARLDARGPQAPGWRHLGGLAKARFFARRPLGRSPRGSAAIPRKTSGSCSIRSMWRSIDRRGSLGPGRRRNCPRNCARIHCRRMIISRSRWNSIMAGRRIKWCARTLLDYERANLTFRQSGADALLEQIRDELIGRTYKRNYPRPIRIAC